MSKFIMAWFNGLVPKRNTCTSVSQQVYKYIYIYIYISPISPFLITTYHNWPNQTLIKVNFDQQSTKIKSSTNINKPKNIIRSQKTIKFQSFLTVLLEIQNRNQNRKKRIETKVSLIFPIVSRQPNGETHFEVTQLFF